MHRYALVCALLCVSFGPALAGAPPPYPYASYPLPTSAANLEGALGGMYNAASWAQVLKPAVDFWWNDRSVNHNRLDNYGLAFGRKLGASIYRNDFIGPTGATAHVTDYQIGVGSGTGKTLGGVAYGWSSGDTQLLDRENYLSFGTILNPGRDVTLGFNWRKALGTSARDLLGSFVLRPLGDQRLVVFADYALRSKQVWNEGALQGGISIRPVHTVQAVFRKREGGEFQVGIGISSSDATVGAASDYLDGDRQRTDYLIRVNNPGLNASH